MGTSWRRHGPTINHRGDTMEAPWTHHEPNMEALRKHHGPTMGAQWRHQGDTTAAAMGTPRKHVGSSTDPGSTMNVQ